MKALGIDGRIGVSTHFDLQSSLDTIRDLDFIRVCGSAGERRGMNVVTRQLDEIGVGWRFHTFRDKWLEAVDPHVLVRGRQIAVRPAMELSFQQGVDFGTSDVLGVDVRAELARTDRCSGKIAVAEHFSIDTPTENGAIAQLMAFPFEPEMEAYLWAQAGDGRQAPVAIVAPEDIPFILDALGERAVMSWRARTVEREFRNLVVGIPGRKWPEEIVLMGAHMDSWPGTVGSSDDAAGCAVLLEAARWFAKHPPARTVRLSWFTGEEVDARGSRTYVGECVDDPRAVKLMVCVDSGCEMRTGPFNTYTSDQPTIEWARQFLDLDGMENIIVKSPGTDAKAFIAAGIPVFAVEAPSKQGPHLPDDDPDNIDPQKVQVLGSLSLQATIHAAVAVND